MISAESHQLPVRTAEQRWNSHRLSFSIAAQNVSDLHEMNNSSETPLSQIGFDALCPGADALDCLQNEFR